MGPMRAARAFALGLKSSGLLAAGGLTAGQTDLVSLIDEEANELNDLASHLLRAAKLESSDLKPNCEPLLLSSLLGPAIEAIKAHPSSERFQISVAPEEAPVMAERKLMTAALMHVLENAAKYSIPKSPIAIEIAVTDFEVTLTVSNHGRTIALADRERIFERFYRVPGTEQGSPGTGLGLSIVRKIVQAHRGRVWVEGDGISMTSFWVALPVVSDR